MTRQLQSIILLLVLVLLPGIHSSLAGQYNGTILFDYTVQNNNLPYGEYIMIRSYRGVTQVLISEDVNRLYLYTDRDNTVPGKIITSGLSRVNSTIIDPPELDQYQFDFIVSRVLTGGDKREISTMRFPGINTVLEMIKSGKARVVSDDNESMVRISGIPGMARYVMKFDMPWNKLTLRYDAGGSDDLPLLWQVRIEETRDPNIKPVIRRFMANAGMASRSR